MMDDKVRFWYGILSKEGVSEPSKMEHSVNEWDICEDWINGYEL